MNVVGTANVFEAARATRGRLVHVVYVSSTAVFGPPSLYPPGPLADDAPPRPATHYGVDKVANEETARVSWEEHGIASAAAVVRAIEEAWPTATGLVDHDTFARLQKEGRLDTRELA